MPPCIDDGGSSTGSRAIWGGTGEGDTETLALVRILRRLVNAHVPLLK